MVCNSSWHLPGNPKLVWHPVRLVKEGGCVDLSMGTRQLNYPLYWSSLDLKALLLLHLFLFLSRIIMLCHCSSTMTKNHFLILFFVTKWPVCVDVPWFNPHTPHFSVLAGVWAADGWLPFWASLWWRVLPGRGPPCAHHWAARTHSQAHRALRKILQGVLQQER